MTSVPQKDGTIPLPKDGNTIKPSPPIRYPKLSITPSPPKPHARQRKPGMIRPPSYTASPINSPFASPPNVGRKRANAISLANSPARRSHSENMARIFEQSRRTVEFQEATRKKSAEARRHVSAIECRRPERDMDEDTEQPRLPAFAPVGRSSDELAGDGSQPAQATASARLARARTFHRSLDQDHAGSPSDTSGAAMPIAAEAPLSPIEHWLTTLPDDPPPKPNMSHLRTPSRSALSPQATTHRLCSSVSSIAQRIALRSPPAYDFAATASGRMAAQDATDAAISGNDEAEGQNSRPCIVLSRLLKPPTRIPRTNASIWTQPPSRAPGQSPRPTGTEHVSQPTKPRKLTRTPGGAPKQSSILWRVKNEPTSSGDHEISDAGSDSSSTLSDSGSSSILYLPKTRSPARDPFSTHKASARKPPTQTVKSTPKKVSTRSVGPEATTCTPAPLQVSKTSSVRQDKSTPPHRVKDEGEHTRELTPEVSVRRKGKALRSPRKAEDMPTQAKVKRCKSFYDKDVIATRGGGDAAASAASKREVLKDEEKREDESDKENRDPIAHTDGVERGEERVRRDSGCFERAQY